VVSGQNSDDGDDADGDDMATMPQRHWHSKTVSSKTGGSGGSGAIPTPADTLLKQKNMFQLGECCFRGFPPD